jgi:hypothetical protein
MSDRAVTEPSVAGDAAPRSKRYLAMVEKYGQDYFRNLGRKGGRRLVKKRGRAYMAAIGAKGGETTAEYSYENRRDWGMKGWEAKQDRPAQEE